VSVRHEWFSVYVEINEKEFLRKTCASETTDPRLI
jgi:hypothetical protein